MIPQHSSPPAHSLSWFAPDCSKLSTNYLIMHVYTSELPTIGHSFSYKLMGTKPSSCGFLLGNTYQVMDHHSGVPTIVSGSPDARERSECSSRFCKRPPGDPPWVNLTNYSIKTKSRPFFNPSSWTVPETWRSPERN